MLVQHHDTGSLIEPQALSLVGDTWATEVVPRLPADLAEQARALQAFQWVRGLATPHDLLRGLWASVVGPLSPRRLGAWAVVRGRADISEAAWRKRLRRRNDWLLWLLSAFVAAPEAPGSTCPRPPGRLRLVDASGLQQPGGTGDDWRRHVSPATRRAASVPASRQRRLPPGRASTPTALPSASQPARRALPAMRKAGGNAVSGRAGRLRGPRLSGG